MYRRTPPLSSIIGATRLNFRSTTVMEDSNSIVDEKITERLGIRGLPNRRLQTPTLTA